MDFDTRYISLALEAGAAILDVRRQGQDAQTKADGSLVTEADTRAEAIILKGLSEIDAGTAVVAEEQMAAGHCPTPLPNRFYLVDPLDGTREFVDDRDEFTVNIALIENGVPTLGIVMAPALGEGFVGGNGKAWHLSTADGEVTAATEIEAAPRPDALRAVCSRSHASPETYAFLDCFEVCERLSFGSSLKICRVAEGRADIYPRFGRTMEWDTAAADAVLRNAGGVIVNCGGQALVYGNRHGAASDGDFANPHFIALGGWSAADCADVVDPARKALGTG